jgi:hypothetical protein
VRVLPRCVYQSMCVVAYAPHGPVHARISFDKMLNVCA